MRSNKLMPVVSSPGRHAALEAATDDPSPSVVLDRRDAREAADDWPAAHGSQTLVNEMLRPVFELLRLPPRLHRQIAQPASRARKRAAPPPPPAMATMVVRPIPPPEDKLLLAVCTTSGGAGGESGGSGGSGGLGKPEAGGCASSFEGSVVASKTGWV